MQMAENKTTNKTADPRAGGWYVEQVVAICTELRGEEVRWCAWHKAESVSPAWTELVRSYGARKPVGVVNRKIAADVWAAWSRWLKSRVRVNAEPDISDPSRFTSMMFAHSFAPLVTFLARLGDDCDQRAALNLTSAAPDWAAVEATVARQPLDVQLLTFLHLYIRLASPLSRRLILKPRNSEQQQRPADPYLRMLWQQCVVIQNAALPLFTRVWMTRSLYESALPVAVFWSKSCDGPSLGFFADKRIDVPCGTESVRSRSGGNEAWIMNTSRSAFGKPVSVDLGRALVETAHLATAHRQPTSLDTVGLRTVGERLIVAASGRVPSDQELQVLVTLDTGNTNNVPISDPIGVLVHMLHVTNAILLLYEAAASDWLHVARRRTSRLQLIHGLILNVLFPIIVQMQIASARTGRVSTSDLTQRVLREAENVWRRVLGFDPILFPRAQLLAYLSYNEERQDLPKAERLGQDLVQLAMLVHAHSLMTLSQMRRAVATFWSMLWAGVLLSVSEVSAERSAEKVRDVWAEQWNLLDLPGTVPHSILTL